MDGDKQDKVIVEEGRYRVVHRMRRNYTFSYHVQCLSAYTPGRYVDASGPWRYERTAVQKMRESIEANANVTAL